MKRANQHSVLLSLEFGHRRMIAKDPTLLDESRYNHLEITPFDLLIEVIK